jgi:hypothetical protein
VSRVARLTCLTDSFAALWNDLPRQVRQDDWSPKAAERNARHRRQLELEIDVLAAINWDITVDELCIIYRTQFSVLAGDETKELFDVHGRKVPGDMNRLYRKVGEILTLEDRTWTHPQSGVEYVFEFPFQSFDREEDMRKAYAHFSSMLEEKS